MCNIVIINYIKENATISYQHIKNIIKETLQVIECNRIENVQ